MPSRLACFLPLSLLLATLPAGAGSGHDGLERAAGKALFDKLWVAAPSSTQASDGLGPLFNARACASCHREGAGAQGAGDGPLPVGFTVRLDREGAPDPVYGRQIQTRSLAGLEAEAQPRVVWTEYPVTLAGGEAVRLRAPRLRLSRLSGGALAPGTTASTRIAPPLTGMGLIDSFPEADILAAEDPLDRDGDGVSGRAQRVAGALGRFGWKAGEATLRQQVASAFHDDLGLSTTLFPDPWGDCTPAQATCRAAPDGRGPSGVEVDDAILDLVAAFTSALQPTGQRSDPEGERLFQAIGCALCHRSDLGEPGARPWSDFLLHDMGPGLADATPEQGAEGTEWRTAPLWRRVQGSDAVPAAYLHDGRARSLVEAILWHGGEALAMRDTFISLPPGDRAALIRFLEGL
jgi:CxxC motif-containing protein (DUF1111 family)